MTDGSSVAAPVDILLLNWNNWQDTVECLESVFQSSHESFRVVVCDNGSTNDSLERLRAWARGDLLPAIVRSPLAEPLRKRRDPIPFAEYSRPQAERGGDRAMDGARFILIAVGENLGFAGGNNVGLRLITARNEAKFVWLLNNDTVVAANAMCELVKVATRDGALGSVGATLLEYWSPNVVQAAGGGRLVSWQGLPREHSATGQARGSREGTHPDRLDFISMGCLLVPLDVVKRVGLIDERYFLYCEDIDYSLRVRALGWRLAFAAGAEVWHKGGAAAIHGSSRHDYYMVRSALLLVHKFFPRRLPIAFGFSLFRCALPKVVRGQWTRLRAVLRAYRDFAAAAR
jgi:GT2 family glycosyltransferase